MHEYADLTVRPFQVHVDVSNAAVFGRVRDGLLYDPKNRNGNLPRQVSRYVLMREIKFDPLLFMVPYRAS